MKKILFVITLFSALSISKASAQADAATGASKQSQTLEADYLTQAQQEAQEQKYDYRRSITSLLVCEGKMKVLTEEFRLLLTLFTQQEYPYLADDRLTHFVNLYLNTKFLADVSEYAIPFYAQGEVTIADMAYLVERYQNDGLTAVKAYKKLNDDEHVKPIEAFVRQQVAVIEQGGTPQYATTPNCSAGYKQLFNQFWEVTNMDNIMDFVAYMAGKYDEKIKAYLAKDMPIHYLNTACQIMPEVHMRYFINLSNQEAGKHAKNAYDYLTKEFKPLEQSIEASYKTWLGTKL